jgi:hypothetical protein
LRPFHPPTGVVEEIVGIFPGPLKFRLEVCAGPPVPVFAPTALIYEGFYRIHSGRNSAKHPKIYLSLLKPVKNLPMAFERLIKTGVQDCQF